MAEVGGGHVQGVDGGVGIIMLAAPTVIFSGGGTVENIRVIVYVRGQAGVALGVKVDTDGRTGGTEEGTDGSAKLSLFDVSDPKKPKEIDTLILKNADFNTGYKAFVTDASDNTFLVPYDSWQYKTVNEGYVHETVSSQTAGILRVAVESGKIVKKNAYEVTTASNRDIDYYQFSRAAFVGDTVYGIDCWSTDGRVVSFDKTTGEKLSEFVYDSYR